MTTARSVLRSLLANELYSTRFTSLATTSAGNSGGTTLVDTGLKNLPGGNDDDFCNGFYVIITELVSGGPAVGESAKVSDYDATSVPGTITLESALTAQIKTGTSYELHRYDPTDLNTALNRAVEQLYPFLYITKRDETLITDQLLSNGDFDTYSSGFTGWTLVGTPTVAEETTRRVHGVDSCKITVSGAAATEGEEQNIFTGVNFREVVGKTLHVRAWSFCSTADVARIRVTFDGSTFTNGTYHGGDAEWENDALQYIDVTIPADATEMTISCEVTGDTIVGYFDLVRAWIDPIYRYTIPTAILKGPYTLSIQRNIDEPEGPFDPIDDWHAEEDSGTRYIILNHAQPPGRILRVTGIGKLSTMSSDTATTEIDAPRTHLVVARAAQWLFENLTEDTAMMGQESYAKSAAKWKARVDELLATPGMRMASMGVAAKRVWSYG